MYSNLKKGFSFEETLRAYFIRSGNYCIRGVLLRQAKEDITDIDLWLYERPSGASRRRKIVDAKFKKSPKAVERILFTRGMADYLNIEEAYVATCDKRPILEEFSSRIGISVINGQDLQLMSKREKLLFPERISEEDYISLLREVDRNRRNKVLKNLHEDLKSSLLCNMGAGALNNALITCGIVARALLSSYPNGKGAEASTRLLYFTCSVIAICLDFILSKFWFRSLSEKRDALINSIKYGHHNKGYGQEKIRVASALVTQHAPNGSAVAQSMKNSISDYFDNIHADIVVDHVIENLRNNTLYEMACILEKRAYDRDLQGYDTLSSPEKSFLGTIMDFCGIDRVRIANSWAK